MSTRRPLSILSRQRGRQGDGRCLQPGIEIADILITGSGWFLRFSRTDLAACVDRDIFSGIQSEAFTDPDDHTVRKTANIIAC